MMARVYLGPVLQEVFTLPGLETADTWVDDIGADFGDRVPEKAAERALAGCRRICRLLKDRPGPGNAEAPRTWLSSPA